MWEKYQTIRKIGEGGMGEVWLVQDKAQRTLAVAKKLKTSLARPKDLLRFRRELESLAGLDHPNIVKVFDVSDEPESPGYVMEYCPNGSLDDQVASGTISRTQIDSILLALLEAVKCIHQHGLIHRDIKPGNILIAADDTFRLGDFGLVVDASPERDVITTSNWVSRGFAAPEQYRDMATVTAMADIYSVAATHYYLLRGNCFDPFSDPDTQLSDFGEVDSLILRSCLRVDPGQRPYKATALLGFVQNDKAHPREYFEFLSHVPSQKSSFVDALLSKPYPGESFCDEAPRRVEVLRSVAEKEPDEDIRAYVLNAASVLEKEWLDDFNYTVTREGLLGD